MNEERMMRSTDDDEYRKWIGSLQLGDLDDAVFDLWKAARKRYPGSNRHPMAAEADRIAAGGTPGHLLQWPPR